MLSFDEAQEAYKKAMAALRDKRIISTTIETVRKTMANIAENYPKIIIEELPVLIKMLRSQVAAVRALVTHILDILSEKDVKPIEKAIPELEKHLNLSYTEWFDLTEYKDYGDETEESEQYHEKILDPLCKSLVKIKTRIYLPKSLPTLVTAYGPRIPLLFLAIRSDVFNYNLSVPEYIYPEMYEGLWDLYLYDFESILVTMINEGIIDGRIDPKTRDFIFYSNICPQCDKPSEPQARFCSYCGTKLK